MWKHRKTNRTIVYGSNKYSLAKYAIEYADELVKQLKEKEE